MAAFDLLVAGRLAQTRRARLVSAGGLGLFAFSLVRLAGAFSHGASPLGVVVAMGASGIGFSLFQTPNNHVMLLTGPLSRAGAPGDILTLSRILGQSAGALLAAASLQLAGRGSTITLYLASLSALIAAFSWIRFFTMSINLTEGP